MEQLDLQKLLDTDKTSLADRQVTLNQVNARVGILAKSMANYLPEGAIYLNAFNGRDDRAEIQKGLNEAVGLDLTKATAVNLLASGTTDKTLIPIYPDPVIADITRRYTPLLELIMRVTNYGITADFNQLTARGVTGWKNENPALSESDDTYARTSKAIKYLYQVGNVTGPMQAASKQYLAQNYGDALNLTITNAAKTIKYAEEDSLINGNILGRSSAYGGNTYAAGVEPDGMRALITTNATSQSGAAPSFANLRSLIRAARTANSSATYGQGSPNLIVTDFATKDNIKSLMQSYLRYTNDNYELPFGMKAMEFDGLPILPDKFMPTTAGSRELLVLETDTWQARVLQDMTYHQLGDTTDATKFYLKQYETFICTAEMFNAKGTSFA